MAEVARQLRPFQDAIDGLRDAVTIIHDWQTGFWSNGSGRPPGFFQMRMREDDERNKLIKDDLQKKDEKLDPVVAYIEEQRILKEHRAQVWKVWGPILKWSGGLLCTGIVGVTTWAFPHLIRVGEVLWDDYLKDHPAVVQKLKTTSTDVPPISTAPKTQDAGIPKSAQKGN